MLTLFEYLAVIVSVVIGLGLTRILEGVGRVLEARARVQLYWVHLVFTGIVFLGHLLLWWLFWSSREVQAWSFFPFLFLLLQPIILYLLAGLCFPDFSERADRFQRVLLPQSSMVLRTVRAVDGIDQPEGHTIQSCSVDLPR
jgi:hypothetical protein